jgi:hypothetical protein
MGGASSEIVVGSADLPVLDSTTPADPPVEQAASLAPAPERVEGGTSPSAQPGSFAGIDIGTAHTAFREPIPALPVPAAEVPAFPEATGGREAELRTATGLRAAPAPVVPDLATTGALFSLLAFGGLGLLLATRLHRFRVMKVRA